MSQQSEKKPTTSQEEIEMQHDKVAQEANAKTQESEELPQETSDVKVESLLAKIEQLKAEIASEKERALRTLADAENIRRRAMQDVEKAHKFALEKFIGELLPVIDSLELALKHANSTNQGNMIEGVTLTLKNMLSVAEKFGIEPIEPHGQVLDPNKHQAVSTVDKSDVEPNTIIDVMQKGYALNGRILRPAMVVVSKVRVDA